MTMPDVSARPWLAPPPPPAPATNGLAVAALVLGVTGAVFGLIPFLFIISGTCGLLGVVFGAIGRNRSKASGAPHRKMAAWGLATGIVAMVFATIGIGICAQVANDISNTSDCVNAASSFAAADHCYKS